MDIMDYASGVMSSADCIIRGRITNAKNDISMSYGNIHGDNPMRVESPRESCYPRESRIRLAATVKWSSAEQLITSVFSSLSGHGLQPEEVHLQTVNSLQVGGPFTRTFLT